ncbi:hypothetical protein GOBAR_DD05121 [Gossypium barbadense]|nr:hypothetical protein GOBAR_DD05121 [Gossypium barbadense]
MPNSLANFNPRIAVSQIQSSYRIFFSISLSALGSELGRTGAVTFGVAGWRSKRLDTDCPFLCCFFGVYHNWAQYLSFTNDHSEVTNAQQVGS